jgi:hypothetical protein
LASEGRKNTAHDFSSFGDGFLGECQGQVAHADAAKLAVQQINGLSQADAKQTCQGARERANRPDHAPRQRVFESVPHQAKRDRITTNFSLSMIRMEGRAVSPVRRGTLR